jgi:hypothetical protein
VPTNQHLQLPTIQTTTATPRIAHLFVCVLAADNLLAVHFRITAYRFTFLFHLKNSQFTTLPSFQKCICLFGNRQKSVNEFLMFRFQRNKTKLLAVLTHRK